MVYREIMNHCKLLGKATAAFREETLQVVGVSEENSKTLKRAVKQLEMLIDNPYSKMTACISIMQKSLHQDLKSFLSQHVKRLYKNISQCKKSRLLRIYNRYWQEYQIICSKLNDLLRVFDKYFVCSSLFKDNNDFHHERGCLCKCCINHCGEHEESSLAMRRGALKVWQLVMIKPLNDVLQKQVLMKASCVSGDPDHTAVLGIIDSFIQVSRKKLYEDTIEASLLKEKSNLYRQNALELLKELDFSAYVSQITRMLADEQKQRHAWIDNKSFMSMRHVFHKIMLVDHFPFIQEGCKKALINDRWNDLKNLYNLLKPFEVELGTFAQEFEQHFKVILLSELTDVRQSAIKVIAEFHKKYSSIVCHTFESEISLFRAIDQVCTHAVTRRRALVMNSLDALMKKGLSDTEDIEQVLLAFSYIHKEKDILSNLYYKALAKRLLEGTSHSTDVERTAVRKLAEYGYQTQRMHMMLNDVCTSKDLTAEFQTSHQHSNKCLDNFSVDVLNPFAWPLQHTRVPEFSVPTRELKQQMKLFGKFYLKKYWDRTYTWDPEASSVEICLTYLHRPYVVVIETFSMSTVLLMFEDHDNLSYEDIDECMVLPEQELLQLLQTLVDSRLLLLDHPGKVHNKSTIMLNMMFTNKCKTFRVTSAPRKKAVQDTRFAEEQNVEQQRKFFIQASIVRIMKSQKVIHHDLLVEDVIQQCSSRFVPSIPMIKMCMETLIFKEYVERAEDSGEKYCYIP